ncbi:MAG TPA: hypothetical protein VMW87_15745 [Spirochaetia bacterium]|nr:hypothetical protein [Spirochaetia bacterium]
MQQTAVRQELAPTRASMVPILAWYERFFADREDFAIAARFRDLTADDTADMDYLTDLIRQAAEIQRYREENQ